MDALTGRQVLDAQLDDWRVLAQGLHARFATGGTAAGLAFVTGVVEAADAADHPPDVRLTRSYVDVALLGGSGTRVTQQHVDLARVISGIARSSALAAEPSAVSQLELALDTADLAAVGPFWAAVLTGTSGALDGDDVVDPAGRVPLLWFQHTDAHETPRQRFHLDLWLPHDVAGERLAAAVAAGGTVVDDRHAPSFTVLADQDGNKVCVCTFLDR